MDACPNGCMDTLARLIDRRAPIDPTTPCADVRAIFLAESHIAALAVVEKGKPVGLVYRDVMLGQMAVAGDTLGPRSIVEVMDLEPRVVAVDLEPDALVERISQSAIPVFRSAFIAVDEAGDYVGIGGLASLLSSHRLKQREAGEAMALVERMACDIGHHLEGVLAFTERLEQSRLTPDASAYVRAIGETSRDMSAVLGRAMDLRRAAVGDLALNLAPSLLRDLSDAVEARWSARAAEGGSTLLFSYDGDPEATALIDADRVLQVFDALIDSALSSGRGVIEASLKARGVEGGLRLEGRVRDNTGGSPRDRLARVFDPLGAARIEDRSELALGVGMALAHSLTRAMGGPLKAEANLGAGLTLQFSLVAPTASLADDHHAAPTLDTRSAHILIVDDNATNRMVAEALCEMFDCTSEQVVDGVEAVEAARSGRFDLILMDIKMPRMDGITATRAIRELPGRAGSAPIVALTANADPADVQTYIAAGMQDVVEKPIKPERLAVVLSALLGGDEDEAEAAA
jgi:CheY-like chemotaxis protein/signal transduction histidine kinase